MRTKHFFLFGYLLVAALLMLMAVSLDISLTEVFSAPLDLSQTLGDASVSLVRVTLSVFLSWIGGMTIGKLMHSRQWLHQLLYPGVNFVRHVSPYVWLPFAIIWFGIGEPPLYMVMTVAMFFPAVVISYEMFHSVPREYIDEAIICGAGEMEVFVHIEIPAVLPEIVNLFRILWGVGWTSIIAAEMLGVQSGIGFRLLDFRFLLQYPQMIRYVVMIGLIGVVIDHLLVIAVGKARF